MGENTCITNEPAVVDDLFLASVNKSTCADCDDDCDCAEED
jgi:hypothetical protein